MSLCNNFLGRYIMSDYTSCNECFFESKCNDKSQTGCTKFVSAEDAKSIINLYENNKKLAIKNDYKNTLLQNRYVLKYRWDKPYEYEIKCRYTDEEIENMVETHTKPKDTILYKSETYEYEYSSFEYELQSSLIETLREFIKDTEDEIRDLQYKKECAEKALKELYIDTYGEIDHDKEN